MVKKTDYKTLAQAALKSETGGLAPGLGTLVAILEHVSELRAAARAQEFFQRLAVATGSLDAETVASEVTEHLEEEWCQECVATGYQLMMSTLEPVARACIAVLVAEYQFKSKMPDVEYKRVGALLSDATEVELHAAKAIVGSYSAVAKRASATRTLMVDSERRNELRFWVAAREPSSEWETSPKTLCPPSFHTAADLFIRHGLARPWTGMGTGHGGGSEIWLAEAEDADGAMVLLRACLLATAPVESDAQDEKTRL